MDKKVIHYSDGSTITDPVVQIWDDLHNERAGYYRAYWCASPEIGVGSPVIGYTEAGGSHRTVRATAREVWQRYPDARIYRKGREVRPEGRAHADCGEACGDRMMDLFRGAKIERK